MQWRLQMDLNFIFNQHLKTIGLFLSKKLSDEDFKTFKYLTRQTQSSIFEALSSKVSFTEQVAEPGFDGRCINCVEDVNNFIKSSGNYHEDKR